MPIEAASGLRNIELEVVGFVWVLTGVDLPLRICTPKCGHLFNDPADGLGIFVVGAKVPALAKAGAVIKQLLGQREVAAK